MEDTRSLQAMLVALVATLHVAYIIHFARRIQRVVSLFGFPSGATIWAVFEMDRLRRFNAPYGKRAHALIQTFYMLYPFAASILLWRATGQETFLVVTIFYGANLIARPIDVGLPPSVLFLGSSTEEGRDLWDDIRRLFHPLKVVSLLEPGHDVVGRGLRNLELLRSFNPDALLRANNSYRTTSDAEWRTVVHQLMYVCPIVVVDGRVVTPLVVDELLRISDDPAIVDKTCVVSDVWRNSPLLMSVDLEGRFKSRTHPELLTLFRQMLDGSTPVPRGFRGATSAEFRQARSRSMVDFEPRPEAVADPARQTSAGHPASLKDRFDPESFALLTARPDRTVTRADQYHHFARLLRPWTWASALKEVPAIVTKALWRPLDLGKSRAAELYGLAYASLAVAVIGSQLWWWGCTLFGAPTPARFLAAWCLALLLYPCMVAMDILAESYPVPAELTLISIGALAVAYASHGEFTFGYAFLGLLAGLSAGTSVGSLEEEKSVSIRSVLNSARVLMLVAVFVAIWKLCPASFSASMASLVVPFATLIAGASLAHIPAARTELLGFTCLNVSWVSMPVLCKSAFDENGAFNIGAALVAFGVAFGGCVHGGAYKTALTYERELEFAFRVRRYFPIGAFFLPYLVALALGAGYCAVQAHAGLGGLLGVAAACLVVVALVLDFGRVCSLGIISLIREPPRHHSNPFAPKLAGAQALWCRLPGTRRWARREFSSKDPRSAFTSICSYARQSMEGETLRIAAREFLHEGRSRLILADCFLQAHLLPELIALGREDDKIQEVVRLLVILGRISSDPYQRVETLEVRSKGRKYSIGDRSLPEEAETIHRARTKLMTGGEDAAALLLLDVLETTGPSDSTWNRASALRSFEELVKIASSSYPENWLQHVAAVVRQATEEPEARPADDGVRAAVALLESEPELRTNTILGIALARLLGSSSRRAGSPGARAPESW